MAAFLRGLWPLLAALLLYSHSAFAQEDEDDMMDGMGMDGGDGDMYGDEDEDYGGDGDGGYGGGGSYGELKELSTVADFDEFINNTDASVVGAFTAEKMKDPKAVRPPAWDDDEDGEWEAPTIDNPGLASFRKISSSEYGYRYAYTTAAEVLERIKAPKGGLFLYRSPYYVSKDHGDRPRERFPGTELTEAAVAHWLESKAQPLVGEYSSSTQDRYKSATLIIFMDLDWEHNSKSVNYVLKRARKVAQPLKGKLAFALASHNSMSYELSDYGLEKNQDSDILMGIRIGTDYNADKYKGPTDKKFSGDVLQEFADAFLAGKLEKHKSDDDSKDDHSKDDKDEM